MIYEGLLQALENGVPRERAAILVDQTYGAAILLDAANLGIITCAPVEKSGQAVFDFQHGVEFGQRLGEVAPTFAKALVRYNPEDDGDMNRLQRRRLKTLSDYAHTAGYKFMFELLVLPTERQMESVGHNGRTYDTHLRPELTVRTIKELQEEGIEPDVWKLEGMEHREAAQDVVAQARSGGRDRVGVIVLGRGEDEERVREWLATGAETRGVIGCAVGRTVFWQPLMDYKDGAISSDDAVSRIAGTYQRLCKLFMKKRAGITVGQDAGC